MPEILTLLQLIFPRRILPGHVTYCREIWLQQPKGPGLCSGQDQSWGFWLCTEVHTLLLSAPLWEGCSVCQPLCFQGRSWDFPQLSPWMLLALNCPAKQSLSHSASHWKNWIILNFMCRWFSFWVFSQHRERKLPDQFCFSLQPSSQVVFDLSKVWIIDVYLFRESLD